MADHITEFTSCNIWLRVGGGFQPLIWGLVALCGHDIAGGRPSHLRSCCNRRQLNLVAVENWACFLLVLFQHCCGSSGGCSIECMIISLNRFSQVDHQEQFALLSSTGWFDIQTSILSALNPRDSRRFLHSCLALYCERTDLLLSATQLRLHLDLSAFTVPTPPVQAFLQPAVGQGGGHWDEVALFPL